MYIITIFHKTKTSIGVDFLPTKEPMHYFLLNNWKANITEIKGINANKFHQLKIILSIELD